MHHPFGRHWLLLLLVAVVLTRIPYLAAGYGSDPDAWLVASSAVTLWKTGEYFPSRLPGYPLQELALAPVVALGGPVLSNLCTLFFTVATVVIWSRIAQRHGHHPAMLTLALAFAPVVWQHSADTMDYMWSLCFILAAVHFAEQQKVILSALAWALAIGIRLANAIFIVPLVILLLLNQHTLNKVLLFCSVCVLMSVAAYSPLLITFGFPGWITATRLQISDVHFGPALQRAIAFGYRSVYAIGPLTTLLAAVLMVHSRQHLRDILRGREPMMVLSIVVIIVYLILFWTIPLDRAYLLPAMPFLFLLISRVTSSRQFAVWTGVLIVSGLVTVDIVDRYDRQRVNVNIHEGIVLQEYFNRRETIRLRQGVANLPIGHRAVVMTGDLSFWFENDAVEPAGDPGFLDPANVPHDRLIQRRVLSRQHYNPEVLFIAYLFFDELNKARHLGYTVYCLKHAQGPLERQVGYSLEAAGVAIIDVR